MPAQYEAIRDKLVSQGQPLAAAKTSAARIYNSTHHDAPVTRYSDKGGSNGSRSKSRKQKHRR